MNTTSRWIIGILVAAVIGMGSFIWKMQSNDMRHIELSLDSIGEQLLRIDQLQRDNSWGTYSAWGYQLEVNRLLMNKVGVPLEERPEPPKHLKERP